MTTIAYKDGVLAADTLCVNGYTRAGYLTKIARGSDGVLGGSAGTAAFNRRFLEWITAGRVTEPPRAETDKDSNSRDFGFIVLLDGQLELHEPEGVLTISAPFYACGSGREIAVGAMAAGASAEQAVKVAIELDCYSGGDITTLHR